VCVCVCVCVSDGMDESMGACKSQNDANVNRLTVASAALAER